MGQHPDSLVTSQKCMMPCGLCSFPHDPGGKGSMIYKAEGAWSGGAWYLESSLRLLVHEKQRKS